MRKVGIKIFLFILTVFFVCITVYFLKIQRTPNQNNVASYVERNYGINDLELISDENFIAVSYKEDELVPRLYIGRNFLVVESYKLLKDAPNDKKMDRSQEHLDLTIFSMKDPSKKKIYQLLQNIKIDLGEDIQVSNIYLRSIGLKDGEEVMMIDVYRKPGEKLTSYILNLSTKELRRINNFEGIERFSAVLSKAFTYSSMRHYLTEIDGIELMSFEQFFKLHIGNDEKSNEEEKKFSSVLSTNFATEYPELAKKLDQHQLVIAPRLGMASDEVIFNQINYWFAKKGEDSLPLVYYRKSTKEQIPIRSYEDYIRESKIE